MSLLITGSSGFIGRHLCAQLIAQQRSFEILDRELLALSAFPDSADTVIHLAGKAHNRHAPYAEFYDANCQYALNVASAAAAKGLKRFVYVSSSGVYGKSSSLTILTEESELIPSENYSRSKIEGERQLKLLSEDLGFDLVIVRPALVYGADAPGNIERLLRLIDKSPVIPIGNDTNKRSFAYISNFVEFLLVVAEHPNAAGKVFNYKDSDLSTHQLIDGFAHGMNKRPLTFSLPKRIWRVILRSLGKRKLYEQLFENLILDDSRAQQELDWQAPHTVEQALTETGRKFCNVEINRPTDS
ncbi:NAD-dependent epimerase/dehydratase family protein [Pseudidiomarina salilacus]|uniref:NAD-dependent epimerase/dehydratase family protein n=1 Tax=Pseudidiomarina salilacus TaxID=3384452 RepID=UPI00398495DF